MTPMMVAMLVLGAVCWLFRILFIVVIPAERLPEGVRDGLAHLAPSVMAALVAVELVAVPMAPAEVAVERAEAVAAATVTVAGAIRAAAEAAITAADMGVAPAPPVQAVVAAMVTAAGTAAAMAGAAMVEGMAATAAEEDADRIGTILRRNRQVVLQRQPEDSTGDHPGILQRPA